MKKMKSMISWLLALLLILGTIQISDVGYSAEPKNISDKVVYNGGLNLYRQSGKYLLPIIKDGKKVKDHAKVEVGHTVILEYGWEIPSSNMNGIQAGDFFEFELPSSGFVKGLENHTYEIEDNADSEIKLGTYTISTVEGKQILKAVLNETAASRVYLEKGWFKIQGTVEQAGEINFSTDSGNPVMIQLTPKTETPYGQGVWEPTFKKEGDYNGADGTITWSILAHFDNFRNLYENDIVEVRKDSILIDYLPKGVELKDAALRMAFYCPSVNFTKNGETYKAGLLTWKGLGTVDLKIAKEKWIKSNPGENLPEFELRVKEKVRTTNEIVLGVFDNVTSKIIVVGLGDSPSSFLTYDYVLEKLLGTKDQTLQSYFNQKVGPDNLKQITQEMANQMVKVYSTGVAHGNVVQFNVRLTTSVNGGNGEYNNTAELKWEGLDKPQRSPFVINYAKTSGGVGGGKTISVYATKVWADGTTPTNSVTVRLFADDVDTGKTLTLNAPLWSDNFRGLPDKKDGTPIVYSVKEEPIPGFISTVSKDTDSDKTKNPDKTENGNFAFLITNQNDPNAKIQIKVTKEWAASDVPPVEKVVARIMNGDTEVDVLELQSAASWTATSKELPKFDSATGTEIKYTVKEDPVEGYEATYGGTLANGLVITNTKKAAPIKLNITKSWVGAAEDEYKDLEVKVNVFAEGNDVAVNAEPIVLNLANQWKAEIELPKFDTVANKDFVYSVKEVPVTGFKSVVTGDMANGFVVTNTKEEELPNPSVPVTTPSAETTASAGTTAAVTTTQKDTAPDYFPPATTTTATANIDEDEAARGGVTTTTTATANINDDEVARGGVTTTTSDASLGGAGDKLPHTGNLPNELFYLIGAFVATLGVLVLALDKLKK